LAVEAAGGQGRVGASGPDGQAQRRFWADGFQPQPGQGRTGGGFGATDPDRRFEGRPSGSPTPSSEKRSKPSSAPETTLGSILNRSEPGRPRPSPASRSRAWWNSSTSLSPATPQASCSSSSSAPRRPRDRRTTTPGKTMSTATEPSEGTTRQEHPTQLAFVYRDTAEKERRFEDRRAGGRDPCRVGTAGNANAGRSTEVSRPAYDGPVTARGPI
jgi:hypothetical protein